MAVDGLEEKELGGSSYGFDALFKEQQLMENLRRSYWNNKTR